MLFFIRLLMAGLLVLYPIAVYVGLQQGSTRALAFVMIAVLAIRYFLDKRTGKRVAYGWASWLISGSVGLLLLCVLIFNEAQFLFYYPVLMNLLMLIVFASSLRWPPSVIERLARISEPDLPAEGVAYTRKVTAVWCGFFVFNGACAWYTINAGVEVWTLYNGLISYLLMGLLLAGEYLVRRTKKKMNHSHDA